MGTAAGADGRQPFFGLTGIRQSPRDRARRGRVTVALARMDLPSATLGERECDE